MDRPRGRRGNAVSPATTAKEITKIRRLLNLNSDIWRVPDLFIQLPFVLDWEAAPPRLLEAITTELGWRDQKFVEKMGDSIINNIALQIVEEQPTVTSALQLHKIGQYMTNNATLTLLMDQKMVGEENLCDLAYTMHKETKTKACADVFEAFVGILNHWFVHAHNYANSAEFIREWLDSTWNFTEIVRGYTQGQPLTSLVHLVADTNR